MDFERINLAIGICFAVLAFVEFVTGNVAAAELAVALLAGWVVFQICSKRASTAGVITDGPPTVRGREPVRLLALVLVALIGAVLFVSSLGNPANLRNDLLWAGLFAAVWFLGFSATSVALRTASLAGVLTLTLMTRASVWFSSPGGPVGVDPWVHAALSNYVFNTGKISPATAYLSFPLTHILTAQIMMVTGSDIRLALFLAVGTAVSAAPLFVFLIARSFFDHRAAFSAAILAGLLPDVAQWGVILTPIGLGMLFAIAIVFLLVSFRRTVKTLLLVVLFFFALVLTHPLVSLVLVIILGAFLIGAVLLKRVVNGSFISVAGRGLVASFGIILLAYWMYASGVFPYLVSAISYGLNVDRYSQPLGFGSDVPLLLVFRLAQALVLALAVAGTLWSLSRVQHVQARGEADRRSSAFAVPAWIVLGIALILNSGPFTGSFPGRWPTFGYLLLLIPAGAGLILLFSRSHRRSHYALRVLAIFVLAFLMLIHPLSNVDSLFSGAPRPSGSFSTAERTAAEWISSHVPGAFSTDQLYRMHFGYPFNGTASDGSQVLLGKAVLNGTFAYRTRLDQEPGYASASGTSLWVAASFPRSVTALLEQASDARIYDDGSVILIKS